MKGLSAGNLASTPSAIAEMVAPFVPSAAEIAACKWLTEDEVEVYATEYGRSGFTGALQGYRVRRGSETEQQDPRDERCRRSVVIAWLNEKRPGVRSINGRMAFPPILRACDTELLDEKKFARPGVAAHDAWPFSFVSASIGS